MIYEMMRIMAGPYLCSVTDLYLENQDILNSIVVACGIVWITYNKKYRKIKAETPKVKIMGMTL